MSAVGSDDRVEASPIQLCCDHYVDDRDFVAVPGNTGLELGNTAVRMFVDLLFKCATQKNNPEESILGCCWARC